MDHDVVSFKSPLASVRSVVQCCKVRGHEMFVRLGSDLNDFDELGIMKMRSSNGFK